VDRCWLDGLTAATDAGWMASLLQQMLQQMASLLQLCNKPQIQLFLHDSSQNGTLSSTPLYSSCLSAATHGANTGYMQLGSC